MTDQTDKIEVTQADREAAAELLLQTCEATDDAWATVQSIREGTGDSYPEVQAFARHRQQALAQYDVSADEPVLGGRITDRQREKARLIAQRNRLRAKYPSYPAGLPNNEEPDDILRHCREVIRFMSRSHSEHKEISFHNYK